MVERRSPVEASWNTNNVPHVDLGRLPRESPIFEVEIERQGVVRIGRCPFHDDKTPALRCRRKPGCGTVKPDQDRHELPKALETEDEPAE